MKRHRLNNSAATATAIRVRTAHAERRHHTVTSLASELGMKVHRVRYFLSDHCKAFHRAHR